jgi:hypothetical protein
MIRPAYATIVLTLHREIMLDIDDAADESEEVLTDRVTQLAEQQFGTFDNDDEIDILQVDYLDNRDD